MKKFKPLHLMRSTLQKSDKITCSLQDEIDYVENYIQLQQMRFNKSFTYTIKIDKSVKRNIKVPKHVLYSYVENALSTDLQTIKMAC